MTRERQNRRMNFFKNIAKGKQAKRKRLTLKANIQLAIQKARSERWKRRNSPVRPVTTASARTLDA